MLCIRLIHNRYCIGWAGGDIDDTLSLIQSERMRPCYRFKAADDTGD